MPLAESIDASTISFDTWCKNHSEEHDAKWCRELYPWEIFQRVDYSTSSVNSEQTVLIGGFASTVTLEKAFEGRNGRSNYLLRLRTLLRTRTQQWRYRSWDDLFHVVFDPSGYFITLFTEKADPSRHIVKDFLGCRLRDVQQVRSIPVSGLLFRTLVSYAAHEEWNSLHRYFSFPILDVDARFPRRPFRLEGEHFEPFLAQSRQLWITCSFTEEKAHRLAIRLLGQAERILSIYCHPTFTKHHRCEDRSALVVPLPEFLRSLAQPVFARYVEQTRFLINHLHFDSGVLENAIHETTDVLRAKMASGPPKMPIKTSELREAKAGLGIMTRTAAEVAYVCACASLLNAALNRKTRLYEGALDLPKEVYSFKAVLLRAVEDLIDTPLPEVALHIDRDDLVYIRVLGVQFTFHAIPRSPRLQAYARSNRNFPQTWSGLRLQPIAPLVLAWARALLAAEFAQRRPPESIHG